MSSKSNLKLKDYLSEDGKLDLSVLNLKTVPNVNEIVRLFSFNVFLIFEFFCVFSWLYVKLDQSIYQIIKLNHYPDVFLYI
jgi:hypothetical protein